MKLLRNQTLWRLIGNTGVLAPGAALEARWLDTGLAGTLTLSNPQTLIPATAWYLIDTLGADVLQLQFGLKITGGAIGVANDVVSACAAAGIAVGIPVAQNAAQVVGEERFNRPAVSRAAYDATTTTLHRGTKLAVVQPDPAAGGVQDAVISAAPLLYDVMCNVNAFFKEGAAPANADFVDWFCTIGNRPNNASTAGLPVGTTSPIQTPIWISGIELVAVAVQVRITSTGQGGGGIVFNGVNYPVFASLEAATFKLL